MIRDYVYLYIECHLLREAFFWGDHYVPIKFSMVVRIYLAILLEYSYLKAN